MHSLRRPEVGSDTLRTSTHGLASYFYSFCPPCLWHFEMSGSTGPLDPSLLRERIKTTTGNARGKPSVSCLACKKRKSKVRLHHSGTICTNSWYEVMNSAAENPRATLAIGMALNASTMSPLINAEGSPTLAMSTICNGAGGF